MPVFAVDYHYDERAAERDPIRAEHRAYLASLHAAGALLTSGPVDGGTGALVVLVARDEAAARALVAADPFAEHGFLASVRVREWTPVIGAFAPPPDPAP